MMKAEQIVKGGRYIAKVSGKLTVVRVDEIRTETRARFLHDGYRTKTPVTRYDVTNERTGRKTTFASATKFRKEASDGYMRHIEGLNILRNGVDRDMQQLSNKMRDEGLNGGVTDKTMAEMEQATKPDDADKMVEELTKYLHPTLCIDVTDDDAKLELMKMGMRRIVRSHLQGMEMERSAAN